jgi:6-phosphogluconolactonase (cycloisomerase 2 family)
MFETPLGNRLALASLLALAACSGGPRPETPEAGAPDGPAPLDVRTGAESPPADGPLAAGRTSYLYVATSAAVHAFRVDPATGARAFLGRYPAGNDVRFGTVDARGEHLYVQGQLGSQYSILTFDIQRDGTLARAGESAFPYPMIEGVSQVLVHPTAPWFLISVSDRLAGLEDHLMPIAADGSLGKVTLLAREFYGFNWDPSGQFFFGFDGEAIYQHRFDHTGGTVTRLDPPAAQGSEGHTVLGLEVHPGGKWAYSIEEEALGVFAFDAATGALSSPTYWPGPVASEPATWTSLVLAPSGRTLYASGYVAGSRASLIDVFALNPATGRPSFVEREKGDTPHRLVDTGLQAPALSGDLLWVGGQGTHPGSPGPLLVSYRAQPDGGGLAPVGLPYELAGESAPAVSFILAVYR